MATLNIDIPNTIAVRVATAFIAAYPPPPNIDVSTTPAKLLYVKSLLAAYVRETVTGYEAKVSEAQSLESGRVAKETAAAQIVIT